NVPVVYTADPGVRNPFFSQGYASIDTTNKVPPYPVYPAQPANSVPAGTPIPVNAAFPAGGVNPATTDSATLPPVIPPRRLFQAPDAYGSASGDLLPAPVSAGLVQPAFGTYNTP